MKGEENRISGNAAFDLLRKFAASSREVAAEASWRGESVICKVRGAFSATDADFIVKGSGELEFDVNSVVLSSCMFDEQLAAIPSAVGAAADIQIGAPFATLSLDDGTRITFSRIPT